MSNWDFFKEYLRRSMPNLQINNPETVLTTFNNPRQDEVDRGYVEQYLGFLQSRRLCFLYDSWHQKWMAVDGHS